ncbi:MAG: hypothetical protein CSA61_01660 [Neptuniibacter caesariensis]|uniref:Uncharacterized protein n=1 Tax=Neptuniibacter caesariensis TaxID=207954 RepID=A0A2G6JB43_NEPCE|nr:MAG: hypothetical protein CSA61_01660 [Neptuniibacter caesariensis]
MEWLDTHVVYWHWFVLGALLIILEAFAPGFIFLWFGISAAVIALLASYFDLTFTAQLLIWSALSLFSIFFMRMYIRKKDSLDYNRGNAEKELISQIGIVIVTNVGKDFGVLRFPSPVFGEDQWEFECEDDLDAGDKVIVTAILDNRLTVHKHD